MLAEGTSRWLRVVAVATVGIVVAGCPSFSSESEAPSDVDGGVAAAEAGAPDAPATSSACGLASTFVDTFDTSISPLWSPSGAGLARVGSGGRDGSGMAELTVASAPSFLSVTVSASCVVDAIAYVQVAAAGDGEVDFFVLSETADGSGTVLGFTRNNAAKAFAFEDPAQSIKTVAPTMPSGWTKIELQIDPVAHTYAAHATSEVGALVVDSVGALPAGWPKGSSIWVKIGAAFVSGATKPWTVDFDDVSVMATPTK